MPEAEVRSRNATLWWGLLLAIAAVVGDVLLFVGTSAQRVVPWLSISLAVAALVLVVVGLKRAFAQPRVSGGKILSVSLALLTLVLGGLEVFAFVVGRSIPASVDAPAVGQKAPDFTLVDVNNQPVSLAQLLASSGPQAAAPKAVLLVFYRGYW